MTLSLRPATNRTNGQPHDDLTGVTEADGRTPSGSVDRYVQRHGLFGSPEGSAVRAEAIRAAGVDEIAHLLDFGVPFPRVPDHLEHLDRFRRLVAGTPAIREGDA